MWLRESELANKCPNLRIWSYGYKPGSDNSGTTDNHSINLNLSLHQLLDELAEGNEGDHPIIFITHSLGGLMLKDVSLSNRVYIETEFFFRLLFEILSITGIVSPRGLKQFYSLVYLRTV